jgi:uncharacterized membrane protein
VGIRALVITVFAAATAALTLFFRIPTLGTGGYLNLGDILIIFVGLRFGPLAGWGAGAIGSAAADLLGGYAAFAPVTFIVKGFEGMLPGVIAPRAVPGARAFGGAAVAASVMVSGYLVGESLMPGIGPEAALAQVPGNILQGLAGALGGYGLFVSVSAAFPPEPRSRQA